VTFQHLPQLSSKAGTRFSEPKGCKAELTQLAGYIPRKYTRPKTVTHPSSSTNRARGRVTSLIVTDATATPRRQPKPDWQTVGCSFTRLAMLERNRPVLVFSRMQDITTSEAAWQLAAAADN